MLNGYQEVPCLLGLAFIFIPINLISKNNIKLHFLKDVILIYLNNVGDI